MCQTSVGTVGSEYWTRSYQMQARACAVVALIGLLTGCLESARALSQTPKDVKPVAFDDGLENVRPGRLQRSVSPGPSAPVLEPSIRAVYSEEYWEALAGLDVTALRKAAKSDEEIGLAEGMVRLMGGDPAGAENSFVAMSRQAIDLNVAVAAQIMLATTLLYEHKWPALRDLSANSTLTPANSGNTSELEQWGHAFAGVDEQTTIAPDKPTSLPLAITAMGTPAVQVRINGKDYEFWIDTGSSMTVLSSTVASEAGIPFVSADTLRIRTFEGTAPVKAAIVRRLEIGQISFTNTPAIVMDAALMRLKSTSEGITGRGVRIDGIIGWDIIRQFDVVLDYRTGTIIFKKPEHLGIIGTELQNLTWAGKPLIQVRTKPGGTFQFTLDTGAQVTLLNGSILDKLGIVATTYAGRVFGIGKTGGQTRRVVPNLTLNVGGSSVRLESILVYGPAYSGLINCDGILGSDVAQFGKIRIDATNGLFSLYE
jgi:clan AA aspartic protease (TIGR02281 family)